MNRYKFGTGTFTDIDGTDVSYSESPKDETRTKLIPTKLIDGSFKLPPVLKPGLSQDSFSKLDSLSKTPFTKKKEHQALAGPMKHSVRETKYIMLDTTVTEQLPTINDVIDGNTLDDMILKKTLNEVFESDRNSYLGAIQEMVTRVNNAKGPKGFLPKSLIPREYHVHSSSPIIKKDADKYEVIWK
jgi:hypothetical protein